MAITLLQEPPLVNYSNNPVVFKVNSGKYIQQNAVKQNVELTMNTDTTNGETLSITVNGETAVFSFATGLDPAGDFVIPVKGAYTDAEYRTILINELAKHPVIFKFYLPVIVGSSVFLSAKDFGELETTIDGTADFSIVVSGNLPYIYRENLFVFAQLEIINTNILDTTVIPLGNYKPNNVTADVEIDIAPFLKAYMETALPAVGEITPQDTETLINKEFWVSIWENWGESVDQYSELYTSDFKRVIKGGLTHEEYPDCNDILNEFIDIDAQFANWLSYKPAVREVTPEQEEFLYFFNPYDSNINTGGGA